MSKIIPYCYYRVSTSEQLKKGNGLEIQGETATRYMNERIDVFEISQAVTIIDRGLSAYSGKHISEGNFGYFIKDVQSGKVPKGSALICYSIDRISRQNPWEAIAIVSILINEGIDIHCIAERIILKHSDPMGAITSLLHLMRSNSESVIKAQRSNDGYERKLVASKQFGKVLTRQMPRWLCDNDNHYAIDPSMQRTINFIFESYIAGQSSGYIAQELNRKGWQYEQTEWRGTYVAKLIRDRRLIGEHIRYGKQIKGAKREIKEVISNFYPIAIDIDKFNLANKMLTNVAENIRGRTRISYGDKTVLKNIFTGVIKCGLCGGDITVVKNARNGTAFIRCRVKYELKQCTQRDIKYNTIESSILNHLMTLDIQSLLSKPVDNKVDLFKTELQQCIVDEGKIRNLIAERKASAKRVRPETLEQLEDLLDRIDELRREIDMQVEDVFIPDFNVDLSLISDISNVKDRSILKKSIAAITKSIEYKRVSDYILMEIRYQYINVKHILIVDNKSTEVVANFSIEYQEEINIYKCNSFTLSFNKAMMLCETTHFNMNDVVLMMNFIDFINEPEAESIKQFLISTENIWLK